MTTLSDAIRIAINADGKQAISEFNKVGASASKNLGDAEKSGKNMSATLTKVGVASVGAGLAIGAGLFKAAEAASEADLAQQKLLNTIHNSPQLVHANVEAFNKQADALEKTTIYSHVATNTVQALLGQYKLTQSQILQITPLVEDFASKFGVDTTSAAKAVGKALEGAGGGLQRYGIITGVAKGDSQNFNKVMQALRGTVGGFSSQEGKTFTGQMAILKNELKHTEEQIGAGAIPVFRQLGGIVGGAAGGFVKLNDATGGTIGTVAAYGAAALIAGGSIAFIAGQAKNAAVALKLMAVSEEEGAAALSLTPFGAAAIGVVALVGAYKGLQNVSSTSVSPVEDLNNAIKDGGVDAKIAAQDIEKYAGASSPIPRLLDASGVSMKRFTSAITGNGKAFDALDLKLKTGNVAQQLLAAELEAQRKKFVDTTKEADAYGKVTANAGKATSDAIGPVSTLTRLMDDQQRAGKIDADHLYDIYNATVKVHDAQRDASGAVRDYDNAVLTAFGAQKDYNDAVAKYGKDSPQAILASRNLGQAQDDLAGALDHARQKAIDAALATAGGNKKSYDFRIALEKLKKQFPELAQFIDVYIGHLQTIPRFINTDVTVNGKKIGLLSNTGVFHGDKGGQFTQSAGGNDLPAGAWSTVGEQGWELAHAKPGGGMEIFSNQKSRSMLRRGSGGSHGGSAGGGDIHVHGDVIVMSNDPAHVFDAIAKGARNGRRIPKTALAGV